MLSIFILSIHPFDSCNCNLLFFNFQDVEKLRQEKLEIDQQLRSIQGNAIGSMQSISMSRRNDRGYNSDMDSGNRGRGGSMRGRGRGRGGPSRQNDSRYNKGNSISDFVNSIDKRKPIGSSRGRLATSNGRSPRGGPGGDRGVRDRSSRGRVALDAAAGGDRERK